MRRTFILIVFLSALLGVFEIYGEGLDESSVDISLDLKDKINSRYSFGFSSNEVKTLWDSVDDISEKGVELFVSEDKKEATLGGSKVFVWWKILTSQPFTLKLSLSSFKRTESVVNGGTGEFPASLSFVDKGGEEKSISSQNQDCTIYESRDVYVYGDCDSIPLDIFATGIESVVPGDYSGTVKLSLFIEE